ncbi:MAG: SusC/RagA family TonB-linked outer membrane protein [Bacteroidales bacterium]|nr:SusC/RagA family TonB-linked outer membrane protein [Bacteroidales bacterium]
MKLNRYLIVALLALSFGAGLQAQNNTVLTGTVTEIFDGRKEPIYGANVVVVSSNNRYMTGVITNLDGKYSIVIPSYEKNPRVRFSYIGMKTVTFDYTGQKVLDVTMEADVKTLSDVVLTAKRIDRDEMGVSFTEQTASTQKIEMSEIIETTPVTDIVEALQGQLAGVDIVVGGDPGARSAIRIRGVNSLNASSEPLIVVNGIPYSTEIDDDFNFATANEEDFGALLNIAPSDIESIEVLKDASATAIYGTKGANGVLLITTKRGAKGKTNFSFNSKLIAKFEPEPIPLLDGNQYVALMQDAIWNAANAKGLQSATNELNLLFNTYDINYVRDWQYFDEYNVNTKWLDYVRENAYTSDNSFSLSGGGDKATYRFSLGYLREQGTTVGTAMNRFNTAFNIRYDFSERLMVNTEFTMTQTEREANAISTLRAEAQRKMPNKSPYYIDDVTGEELPTYFSRQEEDFQGAFNGSYHYNPVAMAHMGFNNTMQREEKMTLNAQYTFPFSLIYKGYVSMNMRTTKNRKFIPQEATGVLWTSTYANQSTDAFTDRMVLQSEQKLLYNKTFDDVHSIVGTILFYASQSENYSYTSATSGNASPNLSDPVAGAVVRTSGSGYSMVRSMRSIGQLVYTYDRRYVAKASFNREGNSAMDKSERFGTFPAFGLAWNAHEEPFFRDQGDDSWLTEGKLRVSLGWSGNAPSGSSLYLGAYQSLGEYMSLSAIYPVRIQLDRLKWETSREWNYGADLRFFNKLGVTFDLYDKYTSDLLLSGVSIPSSTGYTTIKYFNSGELSNRGYELRFTYDAINTRDLKLSLNCNFSHNENKVEKLPVNMNEENYTFNNGSYAVRVVEGDPIGSFYGYRYKGVYDNTDETWARDESGRVMYDYQGRPIVMKNGNTTVFPGDAKYEDINYDGVINEYDIVYLGNSNPKFIGGAGFTLKYKPWTLTTFFYGRLGQKVINQARMDLESMYGTNNQSTAVLSRWRNEGDAATTDIPRALYGMGYNYLGSDRFVEDASFVRLKTLTLSYSVPREVLKKYNINTLSVFCTGYDLFTWTKYNGQDPEVSIPSSATALIKDNSSTPVTKRVSVGFNINF